MLLYIYYPQLFTPKCMEQKDFEAAVMQKVEAIRKGEDARMDASAMTGSADAAEVDGIIKIGAVLTRNEKFENEIDNLVGGAAYKIAFLMGAKKKAN